MLHDWLPWSSQWIDMVICSKAGRVWQRPGPTHMILNSDFMGFGLTQPYQLFCLVAQSTRPMITDLKLFCQSQNDKDNMMRVHNVHADQCSRREDPAMNPHRYSHLCQKHILDKYPWGNWTVFMQKNYIKHIFFILHEINSKLINNLNIKIGTIETSLGRSQYRDMGKNFLEI